MGVVDYLIRRRVRELEAHSPQVFEVTELVIPAGTLWTTGDDYLVGTLNVPDRGLVVGSLTLEIETVGSTRVQIHVIDDGYWGQIAGLTTCIATGTSRVGATNLGGVSIYRNNDPPYDPFAFNITLQADDGADGVTTQDITVVQARASFLVM